MSEKVLGTIKVKRLSLKAGALTPLERHKGGRVIQENLYLTPYRVIVANITGRLRMMIGLPNVAILFGLFIFISYMISISANNPVFFLLVPLFLAIVYIIFDKVQPLRKEKKYAELSPEDILNNKYNFAITHSEVSKVELWEYYKYYKLKIYTVDSNQYVWILLKVGEVGKKFKSYENLLRPVFRDKLSVKK